MESSAVLLFLIAQLPKDAWRTGKSHGGDRVSKDLGKMVMFLGSATQCQGLSQWKEVSQPVKKAGPKYFWLHLCLLQMEKWALCVTVV